jgi:hypothetical protein
MNHPKREEWVPYLFGEARPDAARVLKEHLRDCPECRQEINDWQRSLNRLDSWKLPAAKKARANFAPLLKLAAAAAVLLLAGFAIGHSTTASVQAERVRKAIEPEIRQQLRQEFAQMLHDEMDKAETQRLADFVALKKDVDTVAVMTDAGLRRTQRQLVQLVDYAEPAASSNSLK